MADAPPTPQAVDFEPTVAGREKYPERLEFWVFERFKAAERYSLRGAERVQAIVSVFPDEPVKAFQAALVAAYHLGARLEVTTDMNGWDAWIDRVDEGTERIFCGRRRVVP